MVNCQPSYRGGALSTEPETIVKKIFLASRIIFYKISQNFLQIQKNQLDHSVDLEKC